jgi:hypothetical protein
MKKIIFSLLLFFMAVSNVYADGVSIKSDAIFESEFEMSTAENNQKQALGLSSSSSHISLQNVAVPPATWVVGFGLCLVLLSYGMKKNNVE